MFFCPPLPALPTIDVEGARILRGARFLGAITILARVLAGPIPPPMPTAADGSGSSFTSASTRSSRPQTQPCSAKRRKTLRSIRPENKNGSNVHKQ